MASDDLRARLAQIRADAERSVHPSWRDVNPMWVLLNEIDRLTTEAAQAQPLNDAAWGSVWLHGKWSWLTKNMTTPEREHAADCVARWCALLDAEDGEPGRGEPEGLRWWREPEQCCVCGSTEVGYHNYREQPFCWPCADGSQPTTKENLS